MFEMRLRPIVGHSTLSRCTMMADEVRETVDRNGDTEERGFSLLVEAPGPRRDGGGGQQEASCALCDGPGPCRAELEDRQALGRWVVGSGAGRDAGHARVLDAQLFAKERDLFTQDVALGREPNSRDAAVDAPAADVGEHEVGERDGVDDGGLGVLGPGWRQWDGGLGHGGRQFRVAARQLAICRSDCGVFVASLRVWGWRVATLSRLQVL